MKTVKENRKTHRNQTTMYLCINKANQDFFIYFLDSCAKHGLSFPAFEKKFAGYLTTVDGSINPHANYPEDDNFDWCNFAKKISSGRLKTVDYGTACLLKDFFENYCK